MSKLRSYIPPEFKVEIDNDTCIRCQVCVRQCSFDALAFDDLDDRVVPTHSKCVACHRCVALCPTGAINIVDNPLAYKSHANWTPTHIHNLYKQADTGGVLLTAAGAARELPVYFDNLLLDASQVTNPSIDPLREPMELRTYLGSKPDRVEVEADAGGGVKLKTRISPQVKIEAPFVFAAMSLGAVNLNVHKALAMAAREKGILYNTGEGGLHKDLKEYGANTVVQVASGRFGVNPDYLNAGAVVEIKIGQGAKPGIGGHLPGEKVDEDIAETRMIPVGTDALSPAPHHDIYSIEDLEQLISALKEATHHEKPVCVKIAAVHNVAAIASGCARAGADIIHIDGMKGGTGATPLAIRENVGIPIELAIAAVDERLREEGIRNQVSLIAAGGIRSSSDAMKAIALGADAIAIGTPALLAVGCTLCQRCYTGRCAWGITTQKPELVRRMNPEIAAERLCNLIRGWSLEMEELLGAMGVNAVESLRGNRLRLRAVGLGQPELDVLGVKTAGS